jgi:hypothetical protein
LDGEGLETEQHGDALPPRQPFTRQLRNVRDKLPQRLGGPVEHRMRTAYHAASALDAEAQLQALAHELDKAHPGAAASLRERIAETLTVLGWGCRRPWLVPYGARTPSSR